MDHEAHFVAVDEYISHMSSFVGSLSDPLIKQRHVGFVATSAVTAYELAIKDILINFASKKHKQFGLYVGNTLKRINGRIKLDSLIKEHIPKFGDQYVVNFKNELEVREEYSLRTNKRSVKGSYENIITWRHSFVHGGVVVSSASYEEAVQSYRDGKEVINVLFRVMVR